jgi:thymidylate synthase
MPPIDVDYATVIEKIQDEGVLKHDRTRVGTRSVFGERLECSLANRALPLLTTKKVFTKGILHELIWMLKGETNIRALKAAGVNIWDAWVDSSTAEYDEQGALIAGECPKIYGKQWRAWDDYHVIPKSEFRARDTEGYNVIGTTLDNRSWVVHRSIDQIQQILKTLAVNPASRRILLSAWNVADLPDMALPPCHLMVQFFTRPLEKEERAQLIDHDYAQEHPSDDPLNTVPRYGLSAQVYFRSWDFPIGAPFNLVQYAMMTHIIAHLSNMVPERVIYIGGDVHVYHNQWEALKEQLTRPPMESSHPQFWIHPDFRHIDDIRPEYFQITGYDAHSAIQFPPPAV